MGRYRKTLMRLLNRPLKQTNTHKYQDSGLLRCFSPRTMRPGALSTMALPLQPIRKCQGPLWTLLTTWQDAPGPPAAEACGMPGKGAPFPRLGKSPPASLKLASRPAGFRGIQGQIACSLGPGAATQTLSPELQLRRIRGPGALPRSSPSQRKAPGPSVVPSSPSASPGGRTPKLWAHI